MEHGSAGSAATAVAVREQPRATRSVPESIPIAVAQPVAGLVMGQLRSATILAAHSAALVLCVEPHRSAPRPADLAARRRSRTGGPVPGDGPSRVITVLTRQASGVPNGARTALTAADAPFAGITASDSAFVGAGSIVLPGLRLQMVRTIRTSVPRITASAAAVTAVAIAAERATSGVPADPVAELRAALDAGDPARLRAAVRSLVGLGHGSTPGGDDVLCGTLASLIATRRDVLAEQLAAAALPDLATRTPLMSADLLRLAAAGHVCAEADAVLRAVDAVSAGRSRAEAVLIAALDELLAVGNTSGADLATGLAIGLGVAPQPAPRRPRQTRRTGTATSVR